MKRDRSFLTTGEIGEYCHVSHLTVSNWIRAGKLAASRTPGGHSRVRREDFLRFLVQYNFPIPPEFAQEGTRILVVDDDRPLLELMAHTLREEGYQVSVAFDGYEAGLKMATLKPDLLVLDLIMPGVDGFSVCKRVKADPEARGTKIVAITGYVQEGSIAKALECGADLCLEKPFRMETLTAAVAKLLGQRRSEAAGELGAERRRSQRVAADLPVVCRSLSVGSQASGEPQRGKTINVSREGMLLALEAPFDPYALVALQMFLTGSQEPIQALGEARWVREGGGGHAHQTGIELLTIQPSDRARWVAEIYAPR